MLQERSSIIPHHSIVQTVIDKINDSDGIIFATTTFNMQLTALTKNLIDHLCFMLHRPCFFTKKALVVSTVGGVNGVLRKNPDWSFCDLGVCVNPTKRRHGYGSQIILKMRPFAIQNDMKPSCGCAVENIASQKAIEKSGFVSKYKLIAFTTG